MTFVLPYNASRLAGSLIWKMTGIVHLKCQHIPSLVLLSLTEILSGSERHQGSRNHNQSVKSSDLYPPQTSSVNHTMEQHNVSDAGVTLQHSCLEHKGSHCSEHRQKIQKYTLFILHSSGTGRVQRAKSTVSPHHHHQNRRGGKMQAINSKNGYQPDTYHITNGGDISDSHLVYSVTHTVIFIKETL